MIDLTQFCEKEGLRYYLKTPCSRGEFTYATNGHILVRVARRDDAPEVEKFPDVSRVMALYHDGNFIAPPSGVIIPKNVEDDHDCTDCDGSGKEHNCPSCQCECNTCNGSGKITDETIVEVRVGAGVYNGKYISMILAIEGVEILPPDKSEEPLLFRFPEGVGIVMARRTQKEDVCLIPAKVPA